MDPTEKEQLAQEQLDQLRQALKQTQEIKTETVETVSGYDYETHYDPHAQLTFGTGRYSNTVIGNGSNPYYTTNSVSGITYTAGTGTAINASPWATAANSTSIAQAGKLTLLGDDADLVINGVSLMEILRDRLNVMIPNPELEKEWAQLKELGDQYRKLEAELKEKGDMWAKLKAMPPPKPLY